MVGEKYRADFPIQLTFINIDSVFVLSRLIWQARIVLRLLGIMPDYKFKKRMLSDEINLGTRVQLIY